MILPICRPMNAPTAIPIGPPGIPNTPPTTVQMFALSFLICIFFDFDNGALVVPFHLLAVVVVWWLLSRLHCMQAAYKLFP